MYRIIDNRGSGKSSRLMLLAKENDGVLVCKNPHSMREKSYAYGLVGFDIISYKDYCEGNYSTNKKCFIDELEDFVKFINSNLYGYSLTCED